MIDTTESPAELTVTGGFDAQADACRQIDLRYRVECPLLVAGGPIDAPGLLPAGGVIHGAFTTHLKVRAR